MDTMVGKLLEVDRQARQILDEANQYREKTLEELEQEKQRIRGEIDRKAHSHIEDARASHEKDAADAIADIRARYLLLTKQLDERYEAGHEAWEEALFERCTRR